MKTIYWAVVLNDESRVKLLSIFYPRHPNIYAEHMTVAFKPSDNVEEALLPDIGKEFHILATSHYYDSKGQAVSVVGPRIDPGPAHITISCNNGVKPVYSNELITKEKGNPVVPVDLTGRLGRWTGSSWVFE